MMFPTHPGLVVLSSFWELIFAICMSVKAIPSGCMAFSSRVLGVFLYLRLVLALQISKVST